VARIDIFHNINRDASFSLNVVFTGQGKRFAETPDERHELVWVFQYDAQPTSAVPERMLNQHWLAQALYLFNVGSNELAAQYRARKLRSLSFPGNSSCYSRSCCVRRSVVWPRLSSWLLIGRASRERQPATRRLHR
jgi:hypothetical protein